MVVGSITDAWPNRVLYQFLWHNRLHLTPDCQKQRYFPLFSFLECPLTEAGVKYFATFLCAVAVYTGPGLNMTWLNVNVAPYHRRAAAVGIQQSLGNTAGIVAGQIYRTAPYKLGNSFSVGAICVSQMLIAGKVWYIRGENKKKREIEAGGEDGRRVKSGDREVGFEYHI